MSLEMEENDIHVDIDISKILVDPQDFDKILSLKEEHKEIFPLDDVDNKGNFKSRLFSSLLSSVSSDKVLPSEETIRISDVILPETKVESETISSVKKVSEVLLGASIEDFTESSELFNELESFMNSTVTQTVVPNASLSSSSSWSSEEIGAVTIISLMVPFILCSNLFVIMSVIRYRRLHTPTNYFITSLAAVDIFVALATPFVVVIEVFSFGDAVGSGDVILCLLPNRVLMMACGVSLLTLATIAYDRHTALVSPLEYVNIMTSRKVAIMVSLTWIYSAFIVWLPLMAGWYDVPTDSAPCSANLIHGKAPVLFLSAIFVPSCIAILVCYFRIFMVARHHAKAIAAVEFAVHRRLQVKFMIKDTKYAKTLALVIGVFLALWLPYLLCVFIKTISKIKFGVWLQTYLILLAVFNSGINPWIYAFKNNEFRAAFKRLFKEFCRDRLCKPTDRRASLVSAISTTPRLSRTDSRMVSTIAEPTVETISDKLKRSLNSLDEYENELEEGSTPKLQRVHHKTRLLEEVSPFAVSPLSNGLKQMRRQAASCSDLDTVKEIDSDLEETPKLPRSLSVDFILPCQTLDDIMTNACYSPDPPTYHQIQNSNSDNSINELQDSKDNQCVLNEKISNVICKRSHSVPSAPSLILPSPLESSSHSFLIPSIHLQPPPSSSRRPLINCHSTPSNHILSETSTPSSLSPCQSPSSPRHLLSAPFLSSSSHLTHTHSFDTFCYDVNDMSDALHSEDYDFRSHQCAESSAAYHPYFGSIHVATHCTMYDESTDYVKESGPQILSHTHSCPVLESTISTHTQLSHTSSPYVLDDEVCSHLGEITTINSLVTGDGYVSRVREESSSPTNQRYFL